MIANRTSQYRVGVFNEHCFFAYFLAKVVCAFCLKFKRENAWLLSTKCFILVQLLQSARLGLIGLEGRRRPRAQGSKGVSLETQACVSPETPLKSSCKWPQSWTLPLTKNTNSQWQLTQFTGTLAIQKGRFCTFWTCQNWSFISV